MMLLYPCSSSVWHSGRIVCLLPPAAKQLPGKQSVRGVSGPESVPSFGIWDNAVSMVATFLKWFLKEGSWCVRLRIKQSFCFLNLRRLFPRRVSVEIFQEQRPQITAPSTNRNRANTSKVKDKHLRSKCYKNIKHQTEQFLWSALIRWNIFRTYFRWNTGPKYNLSLTTTQDVHMSSPHYPIFHPHSFAQ